MSDQIMKVTTESLKQELMNQPKEKLVEVIDIWMQMYWVCQSYWVGYVERDFSVEDATRLDGEIFAKSAKIQGKKLKAAFHLGGDMKSLAFLMRHCVLQWPSAGFNWDFT